MEVGRVNDAGRPPFADEGRERPEPPVFDEARPNRIPARIAVERPDAQASALQVFHERVDED
jgi:hypothetical protein